MAADERWNSHTEDFLTRVIRAHNVTAYFPNDPDGLHLTASCRCGWGQFFHLKDEDDPKDNHVAVAALTALADAKLLVEVDEEVSGDQAPPIIEKLQAKAKTYRQRAAYEREHGSQQSYARVLAQAVALEEFAREVS